MKSEEIEINNRAALVGTQLQIGKQIMEELFDLLTDDSKDGVIIPIQLNGMNFNITVEKGEDND
ncbi:hypothetical protein AB6M97_06265 [Streptococcus hillyeri]|uniref:hypothetical protein n=1 Tax=Streptococcus hillyeri TaxID=2282420 RepID=UPI0034E20BD1